MSFWTAKYFHWSIPLSLSHFSSSSLLCVHFFFLFSYTLLYYLSSESSSSIMKTSHGCFSLSPSLIPSSSLSSSTLNFLLLHFYSMKEELGRGARRGWEGERKREDKHAWQEKYKKWNQKCINKRWHIIRKLFKHGRRICDIFPFVTNWQTLFYV